MKVVLLLSLILFFQSSSWSQNHGPSVRIKENEIHAAFFWKVPMNRFKLPTRGYEFISDVPMGIILSDPYNGNRTSVSLFSAFPIMSLFVTYAMFGEHGEGDTTLFGNIVRFVQLPLFLANSEHHVNIAKPDTLELSGIYTSVFAGTQTDLYNLPFNDGNHLTWWRLGLSTGFELKEVFEAKNASGMRRAESCLAVQIGVGRYWDLSSGFHPKAAYRPFINLRFGWY